MGTVWTYWRDSTSTSNGMEWTQSILVFRDRVIRYRLCMNCMYVCVCEWSIRSDQGVKKASRWFNIELQLGVEKHNCRPLFVFVSLSLFLPFISMDSDLIIIYLSLTWIIIIKYHNNLSRRRSIFIIVIILYKMMMMMMIYRISTQII